MSMSSDETEEEEAIAVPRSTSPLRRQNYASCRAASTHPGCTENSNTAVAAGASDRCPIVPAGADHGSTHTNG